MEASNYNIIKNNSRLLLSFVGKYVKVTHIGDTSIEGFVNAIDPEEHSIVLLKPCAEECFETIVLLGHAVLDVTETEPNPEVQPPIINKVLISETDVLKKKKQLLLWLKRNHVPALESNDRIIFGNVAILPPYGFRNIYSPNFITVLKVKHMIEKMPADFGEFED